MSEMTATRTGRATLLVAGVLWLVAAWLLWRTQVPGSLDLPPLRAREVFSEEELRQSAAYARVSRLLWLLSTAAGLVVLAPLAWRGPRLAARLPGRPLVRGTALLLLVLAALWLVRLPVGLIAQWWRRRHGISRQPYLEYVLSPWLELLATAGVACLALAVGMVMARRLGPRWWLSGGLVLAVLGSGALLLQPLVLAPRLAPLRDRVLAAQIDSLAREQGLGAIDVEVRRASDRTRRANAEVAGLGPTLRVILWDTLLDGRFARGEVLVIASHELAHASRRHLLRGLGWFALAALPGVWVLATVTRRQGGLGEPGAVPLAVLTVVVLLLVTTPLANVISRRYEAEADWVALETTRDPASARALLRRLSRTGLADPDPPTWSYALLSTHPSLLERVAMAEAWQLGSRG